VLATVLPAAKLLFPVPQRRRVFIVLLASGGFLGRASLGDLLVKVACFRPAGRGTTLAFGPGCAVSEGSPMPGVKDLATQRS